MPLLLPVIEMPGICRKCRRPVYWNGRTWIDRDDHKPHVKHVCKENA